MKGTRGMVIANCFSVQLTDDEIVLVAHAYKKEQHGLVRHQLIDIDSVNLYKIGPILYNSPLKIPENMVGEIEGFFKSHDGRLEITGKMYKDHPMAKMVAGLIRNGTAMYGSFIGTVKSRDPDEVIVAGELEGIILAESRIL